MSIAFPLWCRYLLQPLVSLTKTGRHSHACSHLSQAAQARLISSKLIHTTYSTHLVFKLPYVPCHENCGDANVTRTCNCRSRHVVTWCCDAWWDCTGVRRTVRGVVTWQLWSMRTSIPSGDEARVYEDVFSSKKEKKVWRDGWLRYFGRPKGRRVTSLWWARNAVRL
jgi:hypothetical protein